VLRVEVGGREVDVAVRTSRRARRARIVVDWKREVEIVLPARAPRAAAARLLDEHAAWLERQLARPPRPFGLGLQRDDVVWLRGEPHPLPAAADVGAWYRRRAREALVVAVGQEGARLGLTYGPISIRDQRTRWGSCSSQGALSFNWRLVLAPPDVLDYVVVHELCHRVRRDHSRVFWALVEAARPRWRQDKAWLDEHGQELLAYRVPPGCPTSAGPRSTATER
jgi:predicted metal-dependent hydrolase